MTDLELEWALENWARWCQEKKAPGHVRSIEWRWRSPQEWYSLGPPAVSGVPIDGVSALAVNSAWRQVPQPFKQILADWYCLRRDKRRTCGRLKIQVRLHGDYLHRARCMLANVLTMNAGRGTRAAGNTAKTGASCDPWLIPGTSAPEDYEVKPLGSPRL